MAQGFTKQDLEDLLSALNHELEAHDREDARTLIKALGLKTWDHVMRVIARYYDEKRVPAKTAYFVQEILDELEA